jgi:hypothetical protein
MKNFLHFTIALLEAILKCLPVLIIQVLVIYPLLVLGQGQEAMRAVFDAPVIQLSWMSFPLSVGDTAFPISLGYSCILLATFLYFLLGGWNYPANDGARAFCRIWVPSVLTLLFGLLWPILIEYNSINFSRIWDVAIALVNISAVACLVGCWWYLTKPAISKVMIIFLAAASVVLIGQASPKVRWIF